MLLHPERSSRWIAGVASMAGRVVQATVAYGSRSSCCRRIAFVATNHGAAPLIIRTVAGLSSSGCLIGWAWQDTGILAAGVRGKIR
jgi:hypothetical protein